MPLLLGLGIDELSVSVPAIPAIKAAVRRQDMAECRALAQEVLGLGTTVLVRERLQAAIQRTLERSAEHV
ncbi:phosphoenolpyruvate-protein phosphotransferase [compost metagenome]